MRFTQRSVYSDHVGATACVHACASANPYSILPATGSAYRKTDERAVLWVRGRVAAHLKPFVQCSCSYSIGSIQLVRHSHVPSLATCLMDKGLLDKRSKLAARIVRYLLLLARRDSTEHRSRVTHRNKIWHSASSAHTCLESQKITGAKVMRRCATTYQPRARAGSGIQLHKVAHSGQDISALTSGFYASDCGVDRTSLHTPRQSRSMSSTVLSSQVQSALPFA